MATGLAVRRSRGTAPRFDRQFVNPFLRHFVFAAAPVTSQDCIQMIYLESNTIGGHFYMRVGGLFMQTAQDDVYSGAVQLILPIRG